MRTSVNAVVNFGLVNVPVGVAPAASEKETIRFRTLHVDCSTPIKNAQTCVTCNATLEADETTKGFEFAKGQFVEVTEEELESVKADKTKVIRLNKFVEQTAIAPTWRDKSYFLIPNATLPQPYSLLVYAMEDTGLVGLGVSALWGKERPCVVAPGRGALMLHLLHTTEEIVSPDFDVPVPDATLREQAKQTIESWKDEVEVDDLVSTPNVLLKSLIAAKIGGLTFEAPEPEPEPDVTVDVMAALIATVGRKPRKEVVTA